jgi:hypothetical protein
MKRAWIVGSILILAAGAQIAQNWKAYFSTWYPRIMRISSETARDRAGILSIEFSEGDIQFFQFLRTEVPEESTLIIPSGGQYGAYRFKHRIEYYLFPRDIVSCQWPLETDCADLLGWEEHYILKIRDYPSPDWIESQETHSLKEFADWLGVMIPLKRAEEGG